MAFPIEQQLEQIARGATEIVPLPELKAKLERAARTGRPLKVKLGLDPTAPDIHLGFAVVLRKLRQFQDLGHEVILIIGDYTALIGDPSGRSATRPMLSPEEIQANARGYVAQLGKILDPARTTARYNGEWLGQLDFAEVVRLASRMTVAQVLQREDFAHRFEQGQPISLHELLYPLAQAYDSVAIEADVELGGLDQKFNLLAGRDLQRELGQEPQVALMMPLLVGLDGVKKMSKSLGNYVGIDESPGEMFGKLMSISDEMMPSYYELCTDVPLDEVRRLTDAARTHPREAKKRLAREVIALYHGPEAARAADEEFERLHGRGRSADAVPDEMLEVPVPSEVVTDGKARVVDLLKVAHLAASSGEAKRLIQQGGVSLDGRKITDPSATIPVHTDQVLKVGRSSFARLLPPAGA
ncbi:MAG: tyrosine--tRNA ligase [Armatimonadetes bacterium]|nr:tyrosine--tRNA ligase [Armatimonadota bacterium]